MNRKMTDEALIKRMVALTSEPYYDTFRASLKKHLRLSRNKKFMDVTTSHLALQLAILMAIEEGDEAINKGRALVKDRDDGQHLQNERNRHISLAFKMIADGIAWRTLHYNRFHIRILSQSRSPGPAWKKIGRKAETDTAKNVAEEGHFVILNDATNLIRVGDLIFIDPKHDRPKPVIAEIKKRKIIMANTIKRKLDKQGMKLSKQEKRLMQAQLAIMKNEFRGGSKTAPVLEIKPLVVRDKLRRVNAMFVIANKTGASEGFVTPYMYVSVLDLTYFLKKEHLGKIERTKVPKDMQVLLPWTSYDTLLLYLDGEAARSTAPYTLLPISADNVVKLMLGEIFLQTIIYKEPLIDNFKKLGWDLVINDKTLDDSTPLDDADAVAYFSDERLFPEGGFNEKDYMMLVHPTNGFKWPVFMLVSQMMHEFTTVEYIVAHVEQIMNAAMPGQLNGFFVENMTDANRWR